MKKFKSPYSNVNTARSFDRMSYEAVEILNDFSVYRFLSVEYPTPREHRLIDSLAVQVIGIEKASFTYGYIRDQDERAKIDTAWQHVCTYRKNTSHEI